MQPHKAGKAGMKRKRPKAEEKASRPARHSKKKVRAGGGAPASAPDREADKRPGENGQKPAWQVKQECAQQVMLEMKNIVDGLIVKAKGGSCQHAKFLFDFAGVEAGGGEESAAGEGKLLAELLLRRLDAAALGSVRQRVEGLDAGAPGAFAVAESKEASAGSSAPAAAAIAAEPAGMLIGATARQT
jgi:hypothetical protein